MPAILASVKASLTWQKFCIFQLQAPIRTAQDTDYTVFLDQIGEDYNNDAVSLDMLQTVSSVEESVTFLFPHEILADPAKSLRRAFLSPKNVNIDNFNSQVLDNVDGEECLSSTALHCVNILTSHSDVFYSADSVKEDTNMQADEATPNFLSLQTHNGVPSHVLRLKLGCVCTLMCNLCVRKGLVKNARVIIRSLHRRFVQVQVIDNRTNALGETHCIPRIRFEFTPAYSSWTIHCVQFPLRLAYACTFNSCIGLTLDKAIVDVRTAVFAHGQLYTALSRVRTRNNCRVLFLDEEGPLTANIVYKDLLL
jgi:hypothetical protein